MRTKFAVKALLLVTVPLLGGCVTMTAGSASKVALCDQFRPIRWAAADTDETLAQVKGHNAAGAAICGWKR